MHIRVRGGVTSPMGQADIRYHSYLHAKFQEDLPKKNPENFSFENLVHCFWVRLYIFHTRICARETNPQPASFFLANLLLFKEVVQAIYLLL